jgi:hypothetical protein
MKSPTVLPPGFRFFCIKPYFDFCMTAEVVFSKF